MSTVQLVIGLVALQFGEVHLTRLQPGETHQFDYEEFTYWLNINYYGSYNFNQAQRECKNRHGADLIKITSDTLYRKIQNEVAVMMPNWLKFTLWTSDSDEPSTYQMLAFRQLNKIVSNTKTNHSPGNRGDGYICQRRNYPAGYSHHFKYNGDDYWFRSDGRLISFSDAQSECKSKHSAEVLSIFDDAQYVKVQSQVADKIPVDRKHLKIWTNDTDTPGTKVALVIWRQGTGGRNTKINRSLNSACHGFVCLKRNYSLIGRTYEFMYSGDEYWFSFDSFGTVNHSEAQRQCRSRHSAELVKLLDQAQYHEIQRQVQYKIPSNWTEVMLWVSGSEEEGTNVMLIIGKNGNNEGSIRKENQLPSYQSHGYVCCKRNNIPGHFYQFDFQGNRYWFVIDWLTSSTSHFSAQQGCETKYDAEVATARSPDVYRELQKQIEYRIPQDWHEVRLWTRDQNASRPGHIYGVLEVWREGTGGPNQRTENVSWNSEHGYICQRQL